MAGNNSRAAMMALSNDDVARIVRNPRVGLLWARMANLKYEDLQRGTPRIALRVRAAIAKDPAAFAHSLAHGWENLLDDDDHPDEQFDELALRAIAAGYMLGSRAGTAMVCAVAEDSHLAHSDQVRQRLDELVGRASNHPNPGEDGWPSGLILRTAPSEDDDAEASAGADTDDGDDGDENWDDAVETGGLVAEATALADRSRRGTGGERETVLSEMYDLGTRMQSEATHLVDRLRAAAAAIEQGRSADQLGLTADSWSMSLDILLDTASALGIERAEDLPKLLERLSHLEAQRSERDSKRLDDARVAGELIAVLQREGRSAMVDITLTQFGFATVDEVQHVLAGTWSDAAAGPSDDEDDVRMSAVVTSDVDVEEAGAEEEAEIDDDTRSGQKEEFGAKAQEDGDAVSIPPGGQPAVASDEVDRQNVPPAGDASADVQPAITTAVTPTAAAPLNESDPDAGDGGEVHGASPADFPWDVGDPPLIGRLLLEGREGLAYHLAVAADETQPRRQLLLFACAAAHCDADALELSLLPADADIRAFDANESRLLLAAALRAGMRLGYAPLGLQSLIDAAGLADTGLHEVFTAAATAVQRGHTRRQPKSGPSAEELAVRWADLGREAGVQPDKLRTRNLKFQRGSKVLRHLFKDGQPITEALTSAAAITAAGVAGASNPQWAEIGQLVDQLNDHHKRERLIDSADGEVSTSQQRRRPIIGPVNVQLHESLRDAGDVLSRLLNLRRAILSAGDLKDMASAEDVERALGKAPDELIAHTVGDAALIGFVHWLRGDDPDPTAKSVHDVLDASLLELFELPRDADGRPARLPTPAEITLLLNARDPQIIVAGYLDKGDIAAARDYIGAAGLEGAGYGDRMLQATKAADAKFAKARGEAEDGAARLRALYKDELARDLSERIQVIGDTPEGDRFDLAIDALKTLAAKAEEALVAERHALEARTRALACDEDSKARVLDRLANADETLAVEFLTLLETGQPLPAVEPPVGDDFSEFLPRIVTVASEAQTAGEDAIAAIQVALSANPVPADRQLREGLLAWKTLKTRRRAGDQYRASLATVLRMIGLSPRAQEWYRGDVSRTKLSGYTTARIAANYDRSYVPQFGSQAHGAYDVTMVWDPVTPNRLMDFIEERNRTRPNVVLYFGVLSLSDRLQLRVLSRTTAGGKGFSPIVIDEAVIGWLSTRGEPGWGFTQRVTLPFTTLNPYQPNAAGEVPDEVFVGRADERNRIQSPTGSMFVYGGRQLGKSALLRRVERLYTDLESHDDGPGSGTAAVYIDLKAAGIGEAQEPAALWPLLGERLHKLGIIPSKTPPSAAREVTGAVMGWLNREESNSLLLLLDEADNFLTADANAGGTAAVGAFPVLQALKGLMEESGRRFKAVFAGLHQVQRFHDASNTPVAHGGDDILIGPLRTLDAYKLVESPLTALGYRFENPELVWRLLLQTNYQASLVQIVCDALVRHLQKRQIPDGGGRMVITDNDIRSVCSDPKVRDLIAQRFRWTINLDSRYRLIALVVTVMSLGAEPGVTFSVDDLREECEFWWSAGFSPDELTRNEFERYLVEMQGLGILQQHDAERWALRSPNIIQMLGSPDRLEKELQDAAQHLERPLEYNPTMARQLLADAEGIAAPRSPLTDYELTTLLKDTGGPAQVVFGSIALGIDRVVEVVRAAARADNIEPLCVENPDDPQIGKAGGGGKRRHIIVDLSSAKATEVNLVHICRELGGRKNVTATVVLGPAWLPILGTLDSVQLHKLRRWSTAGLRAWYGSPFEGPEARARLHRVTSGWPKLIESVMGDITKARSQEESLELVEARLKTPDGAREILEQSAIDPHIAKAWIDSIPFSSGLDGIEQLPVSVDDITESIGIDGSRLLADLEALDVVVQEEDGWSLDRVILAAAATVFEGRD